MSEAVPLDRPSRSYATVVKPRELLAHGAVALQNQASRRELTSCMILILSTSFFSFSSRTRRIMAALDLVLSIFLRAFTSSFLSIWMRFASSWGMGNGRVGEHGG